MLRRAESGDGCEPPRLGARPSSGGSSSTAAPRAHHCGTNAATVLQSSCLARAKARQGRRLWGRRQ
eukprot:13459939-Alexandrium_andersonii.AAC.1